MSEDRNAHNEESQDFWWIVLWGLLNDVPQNEWDEFEHDLKYVNRFSSKHTVVNAIKDNADKSKRIIKKGQELFRARVYKKEPTLDFLADVYALNNRRSVDNDTSSIKNSDLSHWKDMLWAGLFLTVEKNAEKRELITNKYKKWKRKRFKGYNAANSSMPPADLAPACRINPENISYLYLSEDPLTCVYEVRPTIEQHVSVATFRATKDLIVFDLTGKTDSESENGLTNPLLFSYIGKRFSVPNTGNTLHYLPTQFLSEIIKQMGFDGIRFKSSLKQDGINIVLFSDEYCKAVNSEVVDVLGIDIKVVPSELYQMEEILKQKNE